MENFKIGEVIKFVGNPMQHSKNNIIDHGSLWVVVEVMYEHDIVTARCVDHTFDHSYDEPILFLCDEVEVIEGDTINILYGESDD